MRMPIFSYFLIVGSVLTGLLLCFGNVSEPNGPALTSAQTIGVTKFKPEPEPEHARVTAVNFAAVYRRPETKPLKTTDMSRKPKATPNSLEPLARNRFAEFPRDNLSIH